MNSHTKFDEIRQLADAYIEGQLTPAEAARLEELVRVDADARRFYVDYLSLNAALEWTAVPAKVETPASPRRLRPVWYALAAMSAAVLVAFGFAYFREPRTVAVLTDTKACKWEAGTLPTLAGAKLPAGRLRLADGLAKLVFASGAELSLEAPVDLELVSPMRCVLHRGRVMANVPPSAKGFVVDTPTSRVTDFGTEFGVTVHEERTADVLVFSGHVDVQHSPTGRTEEMKTGSAKRFTPDRIVSFDPNRLNTNDGSEPRFGLDRVQISTAMGRGRDAFVMLRSEIPEDRRSDTLLLVKNPVAKPEHAQWSRKAYLGFDLATINPAKIVEAELSIAFAPTGMGFASQVPDATFALYGVTEESQDTWDETAVRWPTAPASASSAGTVDLTKAVRLGTFMIAQGDQSGIRTVRTPELAAFLRRDTNRFATIILVRETQGVGTHDLVHGFASRRHPTLAPPTLRLTVE
jgi:ferric-dicitrate binding protein FerR (iron transport regulator)